MDEDDINKERLELALEAAGLDLWENDLKTGEITREATKTFLELGYNEQEAGAYMEDMFRIVHPDDVDLVKTAIAEHIAGKTEQYRCEFRLRSKRGEWIWYANYGKIMDRDCNHQGHRFIGVTFNIDDRKRKEDELAQINHKLTEQNRLLESVNSLLQSLATSDSLTGVANRRKLMEVGENEFKRARRFAHPLSLLILDIDSFKQINDAWGHPTGDRVICSVADACVNSIRNDLDTVARIGGEEFAIVLPETNCTNARDLAERLRKTIAELELKVSENTILNFTISIGVASLTEECDSFEQLLNNADKLLYMAKGSGKNCVYIYQKENSAEI